MGRFAPVRVGERFLPMAAASENRLPTIDVYRGYAIASLYLFQCFGAAFYPSTLPWAGLFRDFSPRFHSIPAILLYPVSLGRYGLAVLFVISGFCVHLSANRHSLEGPRGFYGRRFMRAYPPYLLALLLFGILWPWTRLALPSDYGWEQLASHLALVQNLRADWAAHINPSFWSIAAGAQLCLLYPALLFLARKWKWRQLIVYLAIGEAILRLNLGIYLFLTGTDAPAWVTISPAVFVFSWPLGALMAEAHLRKRPFPLVDASPWVWVAAMVVSDLVKPLSELTFFFAALLGANLIARGIMASPDAGQPGYGAYAIAAPMSEPGWSRYLRRAGVASFSIYLIYQPLIAFVASGVRSQIAGIPIASWVVFGVCVALWSVVVPLGEFLRRTVELPSVALGERLLRSARQQGQPPEKMQPPGPPAPPSGPKKNPTWGK